MVEAGLRSLPRTAIQQLTAESKSEVCSKACVKYREWISSYPASIQLAGQWKQLWKKFHNDSRFTGRMFSPPLLNPEDHINYPAGQRNFTLKNDKGDIIYASQVNITSEGWRSVPVAAPENPESTFLFIGDSFTFGYGVNDLETFPARFAEMNKENQVFNLGRMNAGPNDFLFHFKQRQNLAAPNVRTKKITVIYTHVRDQIGRAFMSSDFANISGPNDFINKPYYKFDNGRLTYKDTFYDHKTYMTFLKIFNSSALHTVLGYQWPVYSKHYYAAYAAYFKELQDYFSTRYAPTEVDFYFVGFPFQSDNPECELFTELKKAGVKTLNFGDTLLEDVLPNGTYRLPADWHPTPLAYLAFAKMLTDYFASPSDRSATGCKE